MTENIFKGKKILVTGGCGSIGSEIIRQLMSCDPDVIRVLDNNEAGHFRLYQEHNSPVIRNLIGDIRDRERVMRAMEDIDIVFHAAALKHVPFCEYNPFEAISSNVLGTQNVVDAAIREKVSVFVGISTDKAVSPMNTMGATKLLSEKIITNAPIGKSYVKFCCVRFGNVLNSSGSVIPTFVKQIQEGGPLTITSKEMTRFFMSLKQAVKLVLDASVFSRGGEIFILKMDAVKIVDLAEVLLEHFQAKGKVDIDYIGIRPGEKTYERLVNVEEEQHLAEIDDMYVLTNSLLAEHHGFKVQANELNCIQLNSAHAKLLNQEEIREVLKIENII
jgi:FlaA1/EpsC-like NDP-sugar epimerase